MFENNVNERPMGFSEAVEVACRVRGMMENRELWPKRTENATQYHRYQKHRYLLSEYYISRMLLKFGERIPLRGEYGLVDWDRKRTPLDIIPTFSFSESNYRGLFLLNQIVTRSLETTLLSDLADVTEEEKSLPEKSVGKKRYDLFHHLTYDFFEGTERYRLKKDNQADFKRADLRVVEWPHRFIRRGIGTAVGALEIVNNTIPIKFREQMRSKITEDQYKVLQNNCLRPFALLASRNIDLSIPILHKLETNVSGYPILDTSFFEILGEGEAQRFDFSKDGWNNAVEMIKVDPLHPTIGCPAGIWWKALEPILDSREDIENTTSITQFLKFSSRAYERIFDLSR